MPCNCASANPSGGVSTGGDQGGSDPSTGGSGAESTTGGSIGVGAMGGADDGPPGPSWIPSDLPAPWQYYDDGDDRQPTPVHPSELLFARMCLADPGLVAHGEGLLRPKPSPDQCQVRHSTARALPATPLPVFGPVGVACDRRNLR